MTNPPYVFTWGENIKQRTKLKALFCAGEGIGNIIMATPCVAALKDLGYNIDLLLHPTPHTDLVCDLFNHPGYVDLVSIHDYMYHCADYDFIFMTYWFAFSGVRLDLPRRRGELVVAKTGWDYVKSETEHSMRFLREATGYSKPTPHPFVYNDPTYSANIPSGTVGIHAGCKDNWRRIKQWPHFGQLAERFQNVVCFWGPVDNVNDFKWPGHVRHISDLSLPQVASAIKECSVFVSNDSGLMHTAHAVGTPTVGIFGPVSPNKSKSTTSTLRSVVTERVLSCQPCYPKFGPKPPCLVECMNSLSLDQVENAVRSMLHE